jgi:hypothetical protein
MMDGGDASNVRAAGAGPSICGPHWSSALFFDFLSQKEELLF